MRTTRVTKLGMAALAAGLLAWVVLMLLTGGETKTGAVQDDRHCPKCGRDLPRAVQESGGECPFCKAEGRNVAAGHGSGGGAALLRGPAVPAALVCAFVALLLVHAVFLVRHRAGAGREEEIYYVNCRKCERRLRYRKRQAGHLAKCPACLTVIVFPRLSEAPKSPWPARLFEKLLRR
jgi:hypothetical protein